MGFVAMLLAAAGAIGVWIWRARNAAEATQVVMDMAGDVKAAARRFGYRRKKAGSPLDTVDDPRVAVAGMMAATARLDGDYSRDQIDRITRECVETFEVDATESADMTALGRWLAQQGEPEEVMRRLARGMRGQIDAERTASLFEMMDRVASVEGGAPSEQQRLAFDMVRRTLG